MTNIAHQTVMPVEQLRDGINALMQTVTTLLEGEATLATLETAIHSHDALSDQLTVDCCDASAQAALERIEHFITVQAGQYYQAAETTLNDQENNRFILLFARKLLALDGIGPATARQLFQAGIYTPEAFYAVPRKSLEALEFPPPTLARLLTLHSPTVS